MIELSKTLAALVGFRRGPQDMPYSLNGAVALSLLFTFLYTWNHDGTVYATQSDNIMFSLVRVYVFGFLVCVLLRIKNKHGRWFQTLFALYGAGCLLELARWLFIAILERGGVMFWIHLLVDFWYLAVCVFIIRHALELSLGRAVLAAVACNIVTSIIGLSLVGMPVLNNVLQPVQPG